MANTKISALTDGVTANGTDDIPANRVGANVRITPAYIRTYLLTLANTWAATQTITPAVNTAGLTLSGFSLTGSSAQSMLAWSGTLNTSGSPIVQRFNLTDAAHGGTTKYFSYEGGAGGTTVLLNMDMNGTVRNANIIASSGLYLYASGPDAIGDITANRTVVMDPNPSGGAVKVKAGIVYGWTSGDAAGSVDTSLARESAGFMGSPGSLRVMNATAIPAGGTAGAGYKFSSTANFGIFFGSGAPSLAAAKGSLYLRSDGSGIADRMYVNTDGSTTWTNVVTAA